MTLTIDDLERLQEKLKEDHCDYQLELQEGNMVEGDRLHSSAIIRMSVIVTSVVKYFTND